MAGREFNEFHILIKDKEHGRYDIEATLLSRTSSENKIDHDFETANAEFKFDQYKILISNPLYAKDRILKSIDKINNYP